ncbi:MAG TPA: S-formylglutathione hydrolase, partial [Ramlibacter sp.]|nr:S-formylglutathione hydrolase [Ramlibacter sp.]
APDTSPRGDDVPDDAGYDLGKGAGFYLNATQAPWSKHFKMYDYVVDELTEIIARSFAVNFARFGITGHSMGGHGALTLALRHPGLFQSVSAFAPICSPTRCPWGEKAFTGYLGDDRSAWARHDASLQMEAQKSAPYPGGILIDQGLADKFLAEQLKPELFEAACAKVGQPLRLRRHEGYDHSYYFIQSFMADHVAHHRLALSA